VPQGPCEIPAPKSPIDAPTPSTGNADEASQDGATTESFAGGAWPELLRLNGQEKVFLVVGIGSVDFRKGLDVFLATAAEVSRREPKRKIRFVWIGGGYNPTTDNYSSYLAEQIARANLDGIVTMIDEVGDLEPIYRSTDLFFLSSRAAASPCSMISPT
jgi:glycosyltransferase involved in cell wall biosynthesis